MAFHDERIDRKLITVVSITSSRLMPSTPTMYFAPRLGIQSARSTIWYPAMLLSKRVASGRETRKQANPTRFAQSLIAVLLDEGISSRTSMPASGADRIMLNRCWAIYLTTIE